MPVLATPKSSGRSSADSPSACRADVELADGEQIRAGGRYVRIVAGPGHSTTDALLVDHHERTALVGDHLLAEISSNTEIHPALEPAGASPRARGVPGEPRGGLLAARYAAGHEHAPVRNLDPDGGADRLRSGGRDWPGSCANRPTETAAALTDDGWLRTGDGGYLEEESYPVLSYRIKDMIVTGGESVYPIEVQEVLSQHPATEEVAVISVPDELIAFARERLAGYKVPRSVELVAELPHTPSGKVRKAGAARSPPQ